MSWCPTSVVLDDNAVPNSRSEIKGRPSPSHCAVIALAVGDTLRERGDKAGQRDAEQKSWSAGRELPAGARRVTGWQGGRSHPGAALTALTPAPEKGMHLESASALPVPCGHQ